MTFKKEIIDHQDPHKREVDLQEDNNRHKIDKEGHHLIIDILIKIKNIEVKAEVEVKVKEKKEKEKAEVDLIKELKIKIRNIVEVEVIIEMLK